MRDATIGVVLSLTGVRKSENPQRESAAGFL